MKKLSYISHLKRNPDVKQAFGYLIAQNYKFEENLLEASIIFLISESECAFDIAPNFPGKKKIPSLAIISK